MAAKLGGDDRGEGNVTRIEGEGKVRVGVGIKPDTRNPNLNYLYMTLKHLNVKYPTTILDSKFRNPILVQVIRGIWPWYLIYPFYTK